ncbi:hypothetical protein GOP47_0030412 [Adiantum capillus-veneris]|nr:hypothetical protein GOP47_0030412 [Adiantum capillus-veneris]
MDKSILQLSALLFSVNLHPTTPQTSTVTPPIAAHLGHLPSVHQLPLLASDCHPMQFLVAHARHPGGPPTCYAAPPTSALPFDGRPFLLQPLLGSPSPSQTQLLIYML